MRELTVLRSEIDAIDEQILVLLGQRFKLTNEVGIYKAHNNTPPVDPVREAEQFARLTKRANELDLNPEFIVVLWRSMIDEVVANHRAIAAAA